MCMYMETTRYVYLYALFIASFTILRLGVRESYANEAWYRIHTRSRAHPRTHARIIRIARPIHAELCNLHTRRMEMHVSRARARNCRLVYFILHRSSMIQLSRLTNAAADVVPNSMYPRALYRITIKYANTKRDIAKYMRNNKTHICVRPFSKITYTRCQVFVAGENSYI